MDKNKKAYFLKKKPSIKHIFFNIFFLLMTVNRKLDLSLLLTQAEEN